MGSARWPFTVRRATDVQFSRLMRKATTFRYRCSSRGWFAPAVVPLVLTPARTGPNVLPWVPSTGADTTEDRLRKSINSSTSQDQFAQDMETVPF